MYYYKIDLLIYFLFWITTPMLTPVIFNHSYLASKIIDVGNKTWIGNTNFKKTSPKI